jgi:hypothetical protein
MGQKKRERTAAWKAAHLEEAMKARAERKNFNRLVDAGILRTFDDVANREIEAPVNAANVNPDSR